MIPLLYPAELTRHEKTNYAVFFLLCQGIQKKFLLLLPEMVDRTVSASH